MIAAVAQIEDNNAIILARRLTEKNSLIKAVFCATIKPAPNPEINLPSNKIYIVVDNPDADLAGQQNASTEDRVTEYLCNASN